ncbi:MAG TPA: TadE/TadG family type IV pilus assembly protein [Sphingopyxis sp.]|nr:TadE/TadG family type IV pilus assembly protein [Sphingopyxis sp.]
MTRRLHSDRRGSIAAEFALVIPLLLLLAFGIIEFGRTMWVRNSLQSAVEDAARCYALNRPECATVADVRAYAASKAMGVPVTADAFEASPATCGSVNGRQVTATYPFVSIVPVIPLDYTINANACRPAPV